VARAFAELAEHEPGSEEHQRIRSHIVELHLPLLSYLARRYAGRSESQEDLEQVAALGLLKAIDRFDASLGHPFVTYAAPTVVGELKRYLRDTGWTVRVPRRAQELHTAVSNAREELSQELGRSATVAEIAARLEVSPEAVAETLDVARARTSTPLDVSPEGADRLGVLGLVADDDPGFERAENRALLDEALATLTEQERRVVSLRFAEGKTQSEIGKIIGVSQMQVSRLLSRSLAKMRGTLGDGAELDL
jgi:RNA polymerase sigma-B factor